MDGKTVILATTAGAAFLYALAHADNRVDSFESATPTPYGHSRSEPATPRFSARTLAIQDKLNRYASIRRDGIDGPETERAIRAFQRAHHLRSLDGSWGPECEAAFRKDQAMAAGRHGVSRSIEQETQDVVNRENQGLTIEGSER